MTLPAYGPSLTLAPSLTLPPEDTPVAHPPSGRYSALFVQRRVRSHNGVPVWDALAPTIRIPLIVAFQKTETIPGGYETASFIIPVEQARHDAEDFALNTTVWVYDGAEPCFYGHVAKPLVQADGSISITLTGAWQKLDRTLMRVLWSDNDLTQWVQAPGNKANTGFSTASDGSLMFVMNADVKHKQGDYCAADYFMFGEAAGVRDHKLLDGIHFEQDRSNFSSEFEFRIYGQDDPRDNNPDLLFSSGANQPITRTLVADGSSGDDVNGWPSQNGYRCLRVGLWCIQTVTLGQNADGTPNNDDEDRLVSISTIRVSNRASEIKIIDQHQTSTLVKDIWRGAGNGYDVHNLLQEEALGTTGEAVTGNIEPSGQYLASISFTDWTTPRQIIETLVSFDGCIAAMWLPAAAYSDASNVSAGSTTAQYWYRQPPELVYKDWPATHDPDYLIRLNRGAVWESDQQGDDLLEATYVTYTNTGGRTKTLFAEDQDRDNYLYEQGWHEAEAWQISPPVGDSTAATLAGRYTASHQQPTLSGTLRIDGTTRLAIQGRGGERIHKLSLVRAGSVIRIVDTQGPQVGRVTSLVYTARVGSQPEQLELTVNTPRGARLDRTLSRLSAQVNRSRTQ